MLEVTRLNGQKIVINCDLIEYIDANPDTTITLTTANKFVVKENLEQVIEKIINYKNKVYSQSIKINQNTKEEE
ncbi:MAG: flagellar protein FlbD [Clostridiales bacterium]|nr:flagellar protein FlbD [Clostridiales bacterium]